MPSYACALIIKKHHDRPLEYLNAPQTHHQLPLTLFTHTDNKNRLVLSHEKTNKTLYSYQTHQHLNQSRHPTQAHAIIQYMLEHAIKETKSTLSDSALLYFKNLLLGETPERAALNKKLEFQNTRSITTHQTLDEIKENVKKLISIMSGGNENNRKELVQLKTLLNKISHIETLYQNSPSSLKSLKHH